MAGTAGRRGDVAHRNAVRNRHLVLDRDDVPDAQEVV